MVPKVCWERVERHADMLQLVQGLIGLRKRHPCLRRRRFLTGEILAGRGIPDVQWHGVLLHAPPWDDPDSQLLSLTLGAASENDADLHIMLNMSDAAHEAEVPLFPGRDWRRRALYTSIDSPHDIPALEQQEVLQLPQYRVCARSVVLLEGRPTEGQAIRPAFKCGEGWHRRRAMSNTACADTPPDSGALVRQRQATDTGGLPPF
jgi:isoamylase